MKTFIACLTVFASLFAQAQSPDTPAVFPKPHQVEWKEGQFLLSSTTYIQVEANPKPLPAVTILNKQ